MSNWKLKSVNKERNSFTVTNNQGNTLTILVPMSYRGQALTAEYIKTHTDSYDAKILDPRPNTQQVYSPKPSRPSYYLWGTVALVIIAITVFLLER